MPRSPVQKLAPFVRLLANSDYINIPYNSSLSPGNGSFVVAIWYRPTQTEIDQAATHVVLQTTSVTYTNGILINAFGKDLYIYLQSGPPNIGMLFGVLSAGTWYRIVIVGDAGAGSVKVYLNGALAAGPTVISWNVVATDAIRIGASADLGVTANGDFAELVFCKAGQPGFVVPTLADVQNDYNRTAPFVGKSANYPLHEGTGTSVATTVGGGSAGTLNGGAAWQLSDRNPARAPQNRALRSEEFDNTGAWPEFGVTVSANLLANPLDGAVTADALVDTVANSTHGVQSGAVGTANLGEYWCASVYAKLAKPGSVPVVFLGLSGAFGGGGTYFNLVTGAKTDALDTAHGQASRMQDLGGGWFRLSIFGPANFGGTNQVSIFPCALAGNTTYTGDGTAALYVFGAQVANGPAPTPYIKAVASAVGSGAVRGGEIVIAANMLARSEDFDDSAWHKILMSISPNQAPGPFGGTSAADTFVDSTDVSPQSHVIYQLCSLTKGRTYTLSVFAKAILGSSNCLLLLANGQTSYAFFDVVSGVIGTTTNVVSANATAAGSGWFRFSITFVANATQPDAPQVMSSTTTSGTSYLYQGAGASRFYLWGAQVSSSGTVLPYAKSAGGALNADAPSQRQAVLLLQNLVQRSEELDNGYWTYVGAVPTPDQLANPVNGTVNADLIAETSAVGSVHTNVVNLTSPGSGVSVTLSAYLKNGTRRWAGIRLGTLVGYEATFDLQNGTISNQTGVLRATIVAVGGGWYRCSITATIADNYASLSAQAPFLSNTGGAYAAYNGDTSKNVYAWGVELTVSPATVPYLKTTNAQIGVGVADRGAVT